MGAASGKWTGIQHDAKRRWFFVDSGLGPTVYLDSAGTEVVGLADIRSTDSVSFAYDDWIDVNGVRLPQSIVRLRDGAEDASFAIDSYQVVLASKSSPLEAEPDIAAAPQEPVPNTTASHRLQPALGRSYLMLFAFFFIGLCVVAWTRREALTDRLCRRLATDSRAWRREGVSVFVSPDGVLSFEGRAYWVGPVFYNRATVVQSSPLFIRVSAKGVSRVVVLARKFPRPYALRPRMRRSTAGFTLVEALASTALFASVIVAVIFPALIILAQADRLATLHQTAIQIAANALVDEQADLEYSTAAISDGSVTSIVSGMTLTVTVSPSGVAGAHDVMVQVADSRGRVLARAATVVGPPVPPPSGLRSPGPTP